MGNVLITGASSGIGAATALALDRAGARVFAGVEHEGDGTEALASASSRLKRVTLDVTSDDSIASAFEFIAREAGDTGLTGVVNNAGVGFPRHWRRSRSRTSGGCSRSTSSVRSPSPRRRSR